MDRSVGPSAALTPSSHLLSHSELVEPEMPNSGVAETVAALSWLGQLEQLAAATIHPPKEAAPASAATGQTPSRPAAAPKKVTSSHPEYTPALRDRKLVEALLRLEKSSGLRPTPAKKNEQDDSAERFAPADVPEVKAVPKASRLCRPSESCQTVFRSTDESS